MEDPTSYRDFLKSELFRRRQLVPAYSQRVFARELSLRHNHLSQILSGAKGLSPARASKIAALLSMTTKEASTNKVKFRSRPMVRRSTAVGSTDFKTMGTSMKQLLLVCIIGLAACDALPWQKSDDSNGGERQISLDGTPADFKGEWNGLCTARSYDGSDDFDGSASVVVTQADSALEVNGACYKEKPLGEYFKSGKLIIQGNDLIDVQVGEIKGKIGSNALTFKSVLTSSSAPGASIVSVLNMEIDGDSAIRFEFYQDGVNPSVPEGTRILALTGKASK